MANVRAVSDMQIILAGQLLLRMSAEVTRQSLHRAVDLRGDRDRVFKVWQDYAAAAEAAGLAPSGASSDSEPEALVSCKAQVTAAIEALHAAVREEERRRADRIVAQAQREKILLLDELAAEQAARERAEAELAALRAQRPSRGKGPASGPRRRRKRRDRVSTEEVASLGPTASPPSDAGGCDASVAVRASDAAAAPDRAYPEPSRGGSASPASQLREGRPPAPNSCSPQTRKAPASTEPTRAERGRARDQKQRESSTGEGSRSDSASGTRPISGPEDGPEVGKSSQNGAASNPASDSEMETPSFPGLMDAYTGESSDRQSR